MSKTQQATDAVVEKAAAAEFAYNNPDADWTSQNRATKDRWRAVARNNSPERLVTLASSPAAASKMKCGAPADLLKFLETHIIDIERAPEFMDGILAALNRYHCASKLSKSDVNDRLTEIAALSHGLAKELSDAAGLEAWTVAVYGDKAAQSAIPNPELFAQQMRLVAIACEKERTARATGGQSPNEEKRVLGLTLAHLWMAISGKLPSHSGDNAFDAPRTLFAQFVRECAIFAPQLALGTGFNGFVKEAVSAFKSHRVKTS